MSSSVGYGYSYVDLEAAERRRLRAEIAQLNARAQMARAQVAGLSGGRSRAVAGRRSAPRSSAGSTELAQLEYRLRREVEEAEQEAAALMMTTWATRLAGTATRAAGRGGQGLARSTDPPERAASGEVAMTESAGQAEVRAAERLMTVELRRCGAADLESLHETVTGLKTATTTQGARRILAELELAVTASIRKRQAAEQAEAVRASLLALAEEARPAECDKLRSMISSAPDPGGLSGAVGQAVARADADRARDAVARAASEALAEIGCDVGADFASLLTAAGEGVVALGQQWAPGYGLLVRLPPGEDRLRAAVVRHADLAVSAATDLAVQQQFCDQGLGPLLSGLDGNGIRLRPEVSIAPGQTRMASVAAERWPAPAQTPTARKRPAANERAARPAAARERHHGR